MKEIFNRRSIRKYENKPVENEKIEKLLRAAMQAPSAGNQRPWEFMTITNNDTLKKLAEMSPYSKMLADAPLAIVLLYRAEGLPLSEYVPQDMGASAENILLEAVHLGLGTVWLGVYPLEDRMTFVSELFSLPQKVKPFAVIPIGYPDGQSNDFTDRFDASRVHSEKW